MLDYERARKLIEENIGADFIGGRPLEWIEAAEIRLGLKFPATYREFLKDFGCGGFRSEEFYGIVRDSFESGKAPNGIWLTLHERSNAQLKSSMVIVQSGGDGTWYAIDTAMPSGHNESPVILLDVNCIPIEIISEDFGSFFFDRVSFALT